MKPPTGFCAHCHEVREHDEATVEVVTANQRTGTKAVRGRCIVCATKMYTLISNEAARSMTA